MLPVDLGVELDIAIRPSGRSMPTRAASGVNTQRLGKGRYEIDLELRPPAGTRYETIISAISSVPEIEILEAGLPSE